MSCTVTNLVGYWCFNTLHLELIYREMLIFIGWQGNDKPIFFWHGLKGKYKIIFLLLQIIMSVPSQECVPMVNVSI
jgi:hypothetical protein